MKIALLSLGLLAVTVSVPLSAATLDPATMMPGEWTEYRFERLALVRANPALAEQQKVLDAQIAAQAEKVNAAMIQADPSVAPLIARVRKLIQGNWYAPKAQTLSVTEWKQLRVARATALSDNPALAAENKALLKKKKALDARIDAALAKQDPSLAPLIQKFQKTGAGQY